MNLLDLAQEIGLYPKRVASTNGGEYHSPCPACDGNDRFCIWPNQGSQGRYWCRQCEANGDAIQFCRDFLGLSFRDACQKVGTPLTRHYPNQHYNQIPPLFLPQESSASPPQWREKALEFSCECHQYLKNNSTALNELYRRGISRNTIEERLIGWNPSDRWVLREVWGLEEELKSDGSPRKLWLPKGWVIPSFQRQPFPQKLKIRRSEWKQEDKLPKYVEISGSRKQFAIFGNSALPIVIVEAEFDAMLIAQEAGEHCCALALGGIGKKPDREIHELLKSAPKILFCLDFDEAGKKAFPFWKNTYSKLVAWPVPKGKSPGDAYHEGVDIYEWIQLGLQKTKKRF